MTPAGFIIYFTEGRNLGRLFAVVGAGFGALFVLYGMLWLVNNFISKRTFLKIWEDGTMEIIINKKVENINLMEVENVKASLGTPGLIPITIICTKGSKVKTRLPGTMTEKQVKDLQKAFELFDVMLEVN